MLVTSAGFTTAGAALAHLDLALGIVRSYSPTLAALAARYLLVEARGSQAEFVIPDHLAHADPVVERFEGWARQQLAHGFSLAEAAIAAGASERTLARRLQGVLGKSPLSYFQDLRVERGCVSAAQQHRKRRPDRRAHRLCGRGDLARPVATQAWPRCAGVAHGRLIGFALGGRRGIEQPGSSHFPTSANVKGCGMPARRAPQGIEHR